MTSRRTTILYLLAIGVALELFVLSGLFVLSQRNPLEQLRVLAGEAATPTETPTVTRSPTRAPSFTPSRIAWTVTPIPLPSPTWTATALAAPSVVSKISATLPAKTGTRPALKASATLTCAPTTPTRFNPAPTHTPTIVVIEGTAIQFVSVSGGTPGANGNVVAQTTAGANCALLYIQPAGAKSDAPELAKNKLADGNGRVEWTWKNEADLKRGTGIVVVTCNGVSTTAQIIVQ